MIAAYFNFLTRRIFINILLIAMIVVSVSAYLSNISTLYFVNSKFIQAEKLLDNGFYYFSSVENKKELPEDFSFIGNPTICNTGTFSILNSELFGGHGLSSIYYDLEFFNSYKFELKEGRYPQKNNEYTEVLVNDDFFALNRVFDGKIVLNDKSKSNCRFKVVGIMQKIIYYPINYGATNEDDPPIEMLLEENSFYNRENFPTIIAIEEYLPENISKAVNIYNKFLKYDPAVFAENRAAIEASVSEYGKIHSIDEMYQNSINIAASKNRSELAICIIFGLIAIVTIMLNMFLIFKKDIKKLTIYYLCGYSIKQIFLILSMYCATIGLISFMAIFIVINSYGAFGTLPFLYYLPAIAAPIIVCLLSISIVALMLKKTNIVDKIRGA